MTSTVSMRRDLQLRGQLGSRPVQATAEGVLGQQELGQHGQRGVERPALPEPL